MKIVRRT